MFTLSEPSDEDIANLITSRAKLPFTYAEVGATRSAAPSAGYTVDHNRIQLGRGAQVFQRAVAALNEWRQFDLGWVIIAPPGVKLEAEATVAVKARACGLWSLNACRVVYIIDEQQPITRFGFAYGTLPDHVERGEERFMVEWDQTDDSVWYDILAFSRPRHPMVKAGFPIARLLQKRFARDSLAVMKSVANHP
jgi:uncharacterized protein (UPF0548 family)